MIAVERCVERAQQFGGARVVGADHDAVRAHEVINRRAFLEKFRVGDDVEFNGGAALVEHFLHLGRTRSAVPTGTVDLLTIMRYS